MSGFFSSSVYMCMYSVRDILYGLLKTRLYVHESRPVISFMAFYKQMSCA